MNTLFVIAPLFNEKENVPQLTQSLEALQKAIANEFNLFVLFVDDGSHDGTKEMLTNQNIPFSFETVVHPCNLGPGAAFASGFSWLHKRLQPEDWVVTIEGDTTSKEETIVRMLRRRNEGYDVVMASPYAYGGGFSQVSLFRMVISQIANTFVKIFLGIKGIHTFSCFLRLYRGTTVTKLQEKFGPAIISLHGFESMVELLGKLILISSTISEIEMRVEWSTRKGKSKMKIIKTTMGYIKLFMRWNSLSRGL